MDGLLLIDKPTGISSFDVIRRLRRTLRDGETRAPKMGHAGTLDPMASGLLILLLGKATKQQDRFMKQDKTYEAELTLGATSTTEDAEGEIESSNMQNAIRNMQPSETDVKKVLEQFTGEITQIPPQFSAIKVGGQRAYKLARKGEAIEIKSRLVTVHEITNVAYKYPKLSFTCRVSSGTYIRSLAHDIGTALGTGAYLSALRRTRIGKFDVENAASSDDGSVDIRKKLIKV